MIVSKHTTNQLSMHDVCIFLLCFSKESYRRNWIDNVIFPLKSKGCHNAKFVIAGGTGGCRNDNLLCHQRRQSWPLRQLLVFSVLYSGYLNRKMTPIRAHDLCTTGRYLGHGLITRSRSRMSLLIHVLETPVSGTDVLVDMHISFWWYTSVSSWFQPVYRPTRSTWTL